MRAIALLLVIINFAYFGWATWIDAAAQPVANNEEQSDIPGLMLASERAPTRVATSLAAATTKIAPAQAGSNAASPKATVPSTTSSDTLSNNTTGSACTSVGPFQDLTTVVQAAATLQGAGFSSEQRLEQGEMWVGYWLSLQGLATRDDAERALARLKERGIADAYIIPGSDPPNVVSLGVFKDHERAQRRLNEIQQLGLPVQLSDRKRAGSVYWLDVTVGAGQQIDPVLLGAEPGKILRLEMRGCP